MTKPKAKKPPPGNRDLIDLTKVVGETLRAVLRDEAAITQLRVEAEKRCSPREEIDPAVVLERELADDLRGLVTRDYIDLARVEGALEALATCRMHQREKRTAFAELAKMRLAFNQRNAVRVGR